MKLQLALDDITLEDAVKLVEQVQDYIDIIEVGTPFVIQEGMRPVRLFKEKFPDKEILADLKIMDAGYYEAEEALKAGADYITVLAVTDDGTIKGCVDAANAYGKQAVADMICVPDMPKRIVELEAAGVHGLAVHTGVDQQAAGREPIDDLRLMCTHSKTAKISVAGGINTSTIPMYAKEKPDVMIVGGGICHAEDPVKAAKEIYEAMKEGR
ncbi:MAG: 3-hexulose-6-phosphate synthase [Lachnospiraceae bacterium]|nr:3-hexulose-6-phosphate synthase [Lachnospiraceae bacterium]